MSIVAEPKFVDVTEEVGGFEPNAGSNILPGITTVIAISIGTMAKATSLM